MPGSMNDPQPERTTGARGMWLALAFVLFLFVGPWLYGATLPDEFVGAVRARFDAEPGAVWEELADHHTHPLSGGSAKEVVDRPHGDRSPAWTEHMERGRLDVVTDVSDAPRRLVRVAVDEANGVSSRWTYRLAPRAGGGTQLVVEQRTIVVDPGFTTPYYRLFFAWLDFAEQAPARQIESLAAALGEPGSAPEPVDPGANGDVAGD